MRRFIISALVLSAVTANAQVKNGMVGINTDEPRATMHIEPGVSESKGLIIPRITAAQMKTMTSLAHFGADHHAIITYLKETLPVADRTGKLVDVADPGYYYYDNTTGVQKWKTFGGGAEQDFKALPVSMPGYYNYLSKGSGIGGTSLGTGYGNIGIGLKSFNGFANHSDMTGGYNIGLGMNTFNFPSGGTLSSTGNIGIGPYVYSLYSGGSMSGSGFNIGMGANIYRFHKTNAQFSGESNIGIGQIMFAVLDGDLTGDQNIGMGSHLYQINSGDMAGQSNIGIGQNSYFMQKGNITNNAQNNIALGNNIYRLNNSSTSTFSGANNIGIGSNLYYLNTGSLTGQRNIGMGDNVFNLNSGNFSGSDNTGIGFATINGGTGGVTGSNNLALGYESMQASQGIAGNYNIALGYQSIYTGGKVTGSDNIAIGFSVLQPTTNTDIGSYNIGIGNWALYADMAAGNANIQLGNWYVGTPVAGQLNNVVAIGNEMNGFTTYNTDSNTILLGVLSSNSNSPKIGMGTYQPKAKLDVAGEVRVGTESGGCTSDNAGAIRFDGSNFYGCNGSTWKQLDN